jgi:DNA-binding winged helix-turn-helix (wHTH) protein
MLATEISLGWRFGRYRLFPKLQRVMRGEQIVDLSALEIGLLAILAEAQGSVVPKEEFLRRLWSGKTIDEGSLARYFSRLRAKLGDLAVDTVHGVGYKLGCAVQAVGSVEELHALYLTALFIRAEADRRHLGEAEWDARFGPRLGEVRQALAWAMAHPDRREIAIACAGATALLWERLSLLREGRAILDRAVELIDDEIAPETAARALRAAGMLWREADRLRSLRLLEQSAAFYRQLGDEPSLGVVLALIGEAQLHLGHLPAAGAALGDAERILSHANDVEALWDCRNNLGRLAMLSGMIDVARQHFTAARDLARPLADPLRESVIALNIGELEFIQGAIDRAIERAKEAALGLHAAPNSIRVRPIAHLALYYAIDGDLRAARTHIAEGLGLAREAGGYWLRLCIAVAALLAARGRKHALAARLTGFLDRQTALRGETRQQAEQLLHSRIRGLLERYLSPDSLRVWMVEGAAWTELQAAEEAAAIAAAPAREGKSVRV